MKNLKKIPWWEPKIEGPEFASVFRVLQSQYLNDGDVTEKFENQIAQTVGAKFGIATTSGTTAIFLALKGAGVGAGDEVLVPDITFIATANAVRLTGAEPVLVDVDEDLNMSVSAAEKTITKKTKAVVPVHVSGRPAKMAALTSLAKKHRLAVVEDAAEALGCKGSGKFLGTWGDAGCFSFSPNKTITTGQGGMIVTNDEVLASRLRALKDHGRPKKGTGGDDEHPTLGFNFKLSNLQAAVGMAQLRYLAGRMQRLVRHYEIYQSELSAVSGLKVLPFDTKNGEVPQWVDVIVEKRNALDLHLKNYQMDCRRFWFPLHTQKPYKQADTNFVNSTRLSPQALWLPSAFTLTDEDIQSVCKTIKNFFNSKTTNKHDDKQLAA